MPLVFICFYKRLAFYFSNQVLLQLNKNVSFAFDVTEQTSFKYSRRRFYKDIDGYVLRLERKIETGRHHRLLIYDHSQFTENNSATIAESGTMVT